MLSMNFWKKFIRKKTIEKRTPMTLIFYDFYDPISF